MTVGEMMSRLGSVLGKPVGTVVVRDDTARGMIEVYGANGLRVGSLVAVKGKGMRDIPNLLVAKVHGFREERGSNGIVVRIACACMVGEWLGKCSVTDKRTGKPKLAENVFVHEKYIRSDIKYSAINGKAYWLTGDMKKLFDSAIQGGM